MPITSQLLKCQNDQLKGLNVDELCDSHVFKVNFDFQ